MNPSIQTLYTLKTIASLQQHVIDLEKERKKLVKRKKDIIHNLKLKEFHKINEAAFKKLSTPIEKMSMVIKKNNNDLEIELKKKEYLLNQIADIRHQIDNNNSIELTLNFLESTLSDYQVLISEFSRLTPLPFPYQERLRVTIHRCILNNNFIVHEDINHLITEFIKYPHDFNSLSLEDKKSIIHLIKIFKQESKSIIKNISRIECDDTLIEQNRNFLIDSEIEKYALLSTSLSTLFS